jgi:hypothetical protein
MIFALEYQNIMTLNPVSKILIGGGLFLIIIGIFWQFGSKVLPLGRLPGDIVIERENFKFYFPLATSILVSIALSLFFYLIRFLNK